MNAVIIQNMIHEVRGYKVMPDFDLAILYGLETKVLNQSVKRNLSRFPEDFYVQANSRRMEPDAVTICDRIPE